MTLGENVKLLREAKNLTFEELAMMVGTSAQSISQLEKRKSRRSEFAPAIAKFFGVDLDELMTGDFSKFSHEGLKAFMDEKKLQSQLPPLAKNLNEEQFASDAADLIYIFTQASPSIRQLIMQAAKSATESSRIIFSRRFGNEH